MNLGKRYLVRVFSIGIISLVMLSLVLFAARRLCELPKFVWFWPHQTVIKYSPSGLAGDYELSDGVRDANTILPSVAIARFNTWDFSWFGLGLTADREFVKWDLSCDARSRSFFASNIVWPNLRKGSRERGFYALYFDEDMGLFVYCNSTRGRKGRWSKQVHSYIGPDGFSDSYSANLKRFGDVEFYRAAQRVLVFDHNEGRFYRMDFDSNQVQPGPSLSDSDMSGRDVVQIGHLAKNAHLLLVDWIPPRYRSDNKCVNGRLNRFPSHEKAFILDATGRIDIFDIDQMRFVGPAGFLPSASPSADDIAARGRELFAYRVIGVYDGDEYLGAVVAGLSQDLDGMTLTVFDKNGNKNTGDGRYMTLSSFPGGIALGICKGVLETFQPVVFGVGSYLTAPVFDAAGTHRAMFLLPNSYICMVSRFESNFYKRWFTFLLLLLPSVLLGFLLAGRVLRDAKSIGFSGRSRLWWFIGTISFGLAAYIAYRFTRPPDVLVTCTNCGKLRRPDTDCCHNCNSPWSVPELTPPSWRVLDEAV